MDIQNISKLHDNHAGGDHAQAQHGNEVSNEAERSVAKRWTPKLAAAGWTPISTVFLRNIARLRPHDNARGLTSTEALVVCLLLSYKWDSRMPFPSVSTIADHIGLSTRQVRTALKSLEEAGYVKRCARMLGASNQYDLSGLFEALEHMVDEVAEKHEQAARAGEVAA